LAGIAAMKLMST